MGDTVLAANAILLHILIFTSHALDGFAMAAEALAGEAKGAKSRKRFDAAVRASSIWSLIVAVFLCIATALLGGTIIDLLTTQESVRAVAREYLIWSIFLPLLSVWSYQLDGIFIGCTWSREMRNSMILSLTAYLIALAALVPVFGNHGLWAGLAVLMVARAITMGWMLPRLQKTIGT